jgi:hypothetical protein
MQVPVPIVLKGSAPWTVTYTRASLSDPSHIVETHSFQVGSSSSSEKSGAKEYKINLDKLGYYTLKELTDAQGTKGKVGTRGVWIVECPVAYWQVGEAHTLADKKELWDYNPAVVKEQHSCMDGRDHQFNMVVYGM